MAENKDTSVDTPRPGAPAEQGGPWGPLASLRREMDRLFDDFGSPGWPMPGAMRRLADLPPVPAMDLVATDAGYEVTAELPGIDATGVELKVSGDMLILRGEKREESERKDRDRHVSERRFGRFQRSLRLPADADTGRIEAKCANGILTVTIPRAADAAAREQRIEIRGG